MPPENQQIKFLNDFRNQIIIIVAGALLTGLWMNYKFMSTIQLVMQNNKDNVDIQFKSVDKQFEGVNKRIDKVEDKTDGIYHNTVPIDQQIQEPRKKDPNF